VSACNLCGGAKWHLLEEAAGTQVVQCACGLAFVVPQPARPEIEHVYDQEYYSSWEDQEQRRTRIWSRRIERLQMPTGRPGHLLDVGCGTGTFLQVARRRGWEVVGTELSHHGADTATKDGFRVHTGEVWEAGLPPDMFDVVSCWHVIEHVTDPRRFLTECYRVMRPGGTLVLATPNLDDRIFRAAYLLARGRRVRLFEPGERELHLFFFSASTLERLAREVGFERISLGFDRGAAATRGKVAVNEIAYAWYCLSGKNWGMALDLTAGKPEQ
jgi:2-polyprenyl-3-methyl-5-hydroxy-6-metoxy-1,4-benzoquinol methylase